MKSVFACVVVAAVFLIVGYDLGRSEPTPERTVQAYTYTEFEVLVDGEVVGHLSVPSNAVDHGLAFWGERSAVEFALRVTGEGRRFGGGEGKE